MFPRLNKLGGVYGETLWNAPERCPNVVFDSYRNGAFAGRLLNCGI